MEQKKSRKGADALHPMEDLIQVRLGRLHEIMNQLARHSVWARGLRNTDLRILNILYDEEVISINELARRAHVDKAWISRSVVQLLAKKWINKKSDPNDSRVQLVSLTSKSRTLLDQVRPQVLTNERALLQGISESALKKSLDLLMKNAEILIDAKNAPVSVARKAKPKAKPRARAKK